MKKSKLLPIVLYEYASILSKMDYYFESMECYKQASEIALSYYAYEYSFKCNMEYNRIASDYIDTDISLAKNQAMIDSANVYFPLYVNKLQSRRCNMLKKFERFEECIELCYSLINDNNANSLVYYSLIYSLFKTNQYDKCSNAISEYYSLISNEYSRKVIDFIDGVIKKKCCDDICLTFEKYLETVNSRRSYWQGMKLIADYYFQCGKYDEAIRTNELCHNKRGKNSNIIL